MNSEKRQKQYEDISEAGEYIDGRLDYSDCKNCWDVCEATCKLLYDNFGEIAAEGTYIKEIIEKACYESAKRGEC